ncbi:S8 family serine peptidase [Thalassomonas sp. M1454]|uniref:S8 family serine peptidase n=1 Tax=Thalassomonas sp. M1454 TaxID=2594477 RepID=UPI00117D1F64|nr:S8 family serine peptidase [Thalassomonas sp. M1454]TRX52232.1 S8 family serine peptidase [Thalassomonas sp. M1454]
MIFKSSTIAIIMSGALSSSAVFANSLEEVVTDTNRTFTIENQERVSYRVLLNQPAVLAAQYQNAQSNHNELLNTVIDSQVQLISVIKSLDPQANIQTSLKLVENVLFVTMSKSAGDALSSNELVSKISAIPYDTYQNSNLPSNGKLASKYADEVDLNNRYPFLKTNPANGNPVVSIIGSGVDYTHKKLGGEGTWDNFVEGWQNRNNAWDGFPNGVVIGGYDFIGDSLSEDYNPLEYHVDLTDRLNPDVKYKAGMGTMAASMILDSYPDAKILAYKLRGVLGNSVFNTPFREYFSVALEMSIDPNMDGDMSDRADVILIENNGGFSPYYNELENRHSHGSVERVLMRSAAASGALIVTPVGELARTDTYYSTGSRTAVPESIAVGSAYKQDGHYYVDDTSSFGPTRGESILKPDLIAVSQEVYGAQAGTGNGYRKMEADPYFAAVRVAATATSLIANYPELSSAEVRALIVNTGLLNIKNSNGVAHVGGGTLNSLSALKSYALMYEKQSRQANAFFDFVEVFNVETFAREITIKNLTDKTQVYTANIVKQGEKQNNSAVAVSFPETIILQPNEEKTVSLALTIDADKLEKMPIQIGSDYTIENWNKLAVNGYVVLEHSDNPGAAIHLPWLVFPKQGKGFTTNIDYRDTDTYQTDFIYDLRDQDKQTPPHDSDWKFNGEYDFPVERVQHEVVNQTNSQQTLYAMPLVALNEDRNATGGHYVKAVAGGLYPEAQCESGRKLSLAVMMEKPFEIPVADHTDRVGFDLFELKLYPKFAVEASGFRPTSLENLGNGDDSNRLTTIVVTFKAEEGQGQGFYSRYIDYSKPFDFRNPAARITPTKLPIELSPNGNTVLVNLCTEEAYHHNVTEQTFEEIIGMQFVTDRNSFPGITDSVLAHNFSIGGRVYNRAPVDDGSPIELPNQECEAGFIKDSEDNCIEVFTSDTEMFLHEYFSIPEFELTPQCSPVVNNRSNCVVSHELFKVDINFPAPFNQVLGRVSPGNLTCLFPADGAVDTEYQATCLPSNLEYSDGYNEEDWDIQLDVGSVLAEKVIRDNSGTTLMSGVAIKIAKLNNDETQLEWTNKLNVMPNESVRVSTLMHQDCAGGIGGSNGVCSSGGLVFNTTTNYHAITTFNAEQGTIKPNQEFTVLESAETGQLLGQIQYQHLGIERYHSQEMLLISGDHKGVFQISKNGEIRVRDAALLDYEEQRTFELKVQLYAGNFYTSVGSVRVNVINTNDNAPQQLAPIERIEITQHTEITGIDISLKFIDFDGFGIRFASEDLPAGLNISAGGVISGKSTVHGIFTSHIRVSDGKENFIAEVEIEIKEASAESNSEENTTSSSGGALVYLLMCTLMVVRRRKV